MYVDNSYLYVALDLNEAKAKLERCIEDVRQWMVSNKLKLNEDKTEYVLVGSSYFHQQVSKSTSTISIGDEIITASQSARNIGAIVDSHLDMKTHIATISSSCYMHLRNLGQIRRYLTKEATISLIHAFITSKLDNMNGILANSYGYNISRLQKIQNHAARIVMRIRKRDWLHRSPILFDLYWLPVSLRTVYLFS